MIPFTKEFSQLEAEDFCDRVLVEALDARHVSVGENFRFGHGARGDAELLDSRPQFETAVVPLVQHDGARSRRPESGSCWQRATFGGRRALGAPFQLQGTVVKGDARGRVARRADGEPEAGRQLVVPGAGIYAGLALDKPAAISIGVRPTFEDDGELLVEAHLIDFDGDLYGRRVRLAFLERLRDEMRFDSADELVEQMRRDVERVREVVGQVRSLAGVRLRGPVLACRAHDAHKRSQDRGHEPLRQARGRHRLPRGPGRASDRAHQRAHGAPARAQEGPPLPAGL